MPASNLPFSPGDRIVAYLRDSGGNDQELSTEQQEEQLRAWCQKYDLILTNVFIDVARQGSSTEKRNQFNEMIGFLHDKANTEKGVLIWSLSRFARNQDDSDFFKADLRRRHKIIWSITENIPDTAEGRLIEKVYSFSNEKFLENLSIDVKRGLHHNVSEYRAVPGSPPYGFKKTTKVIGIRRDNTPHIVSTWMIDPDFSPIVQQAFKMRADGYQIKDIHNELHILKNRTSYSAFFRNHIYIGELLFGGITISDFCEPIIPLEVWNKVQELNRTNYAHSRPRRGEPDPIHPRRMNSGYILSGILYCRRCGSLMKGNTVKSKDKRLREYYLCTNNKANMSCDAPRIPAREIEDLVIGTISDYIRDPEVLTIREERIEERSSDHKKELQSRIKQTQKSISEDNHHLRNIVDKIANFADAPLTLVDRIREIELDIKKKTSELDRLQAQLDTIGVRARTPAEVDDLAEKLIKILTSDSASEKHTIINLFVNRFDAERDGDFIRGMLYLNEDQPLSEEITGPPPKFMPMD